MPNYHNIVFLDRDGTIGPDVGYCSRPADFTLFTQAPKAISLLNQAGFKVAIVTNQSGIARGFFSEDTLSLIHQKILMELRQEGAKIDTVVYCPHHPDDGCTCRKPKTGLFLSALDKLHIHHANAYVIGDTQTDMAAGKALGAGTIFVTTGVQNPSNLTDEPDYIAENLLAAATWVINNSVTTKHPFDR